MNEDQLHQFQETLWDYYAHHARDLPWRRPTAGGDFDPYPILVSEMMLQQTQVGRVIPKYEAFLQHFPTVQKLADAPLSEVLMAWSGLGYNRRAKYLHQAAIEIVETYHAAVPADIDTLVALPGIGHNTAAAIVVYAYNRPAVFVETNIRTVYLHHFFENQHEVPDTDISRLVEETMDKSEPRNFYWALMDYGTFLKATEGNLNVRSKHYAKQSEFAGSKRQIRGQVLKQLINGPASTKDLASNISDVRLDTVLSDLAQEALIVKEGTTWRIP